MMKRAFIDVETSGLNPLHHGILEIAIIIDIDNNVMNTYSSKVGLNRGDEVNQAALEANGLTEEDIKTFPPAGKVLNEIIEVFQEHVDPYNKLDKYHFLGYNAKFDADFLRNFFYKCGDKYYGSWFWVPPVDVMSLAAERVGDERKKLSNFKLETVARHFGLPIDSGKLHRAMYDIEITRELYMEVRT